MNRIAVWSVGTVLSVVVCVCLVPKQKPTLTTSPFKSEMVNATKMIPVTKVMRMSDVLASDRPEVEPSVADLVARLEQWEAETNPYLQNQLADELKGLLKDSNVAEFVRNVPDRLLRTTFVVSALERWAELDRKAATHWISGLKDPSWLQCDAVFRNWVVDDKAGVHAYISALPAGKWKRDVLLSVAKNALQNGDEEEAVRLASDLPPSEARATLVGSAILKWAQRDPGGALERVEQFSEVELQEKLVPQIAYGYATNSPDLAANWLFQSLGPGPLLNQSLSGVIQIWVSDHDPAEAARWISSLPQGDTRTHALREMVSDWARRDKVGFQRWIQQLPDRALRASVLGEMTAVERLAQ